MVTGYWLPVIKGRLENTLRQQSVTTYEYEWMKRKVQACHLRILTIWLSFNSSLTTLYLEKLLLLCQTRAWQCFFKSNVTWQMIFIATFHFQFALSLQVWISRFTQASHTFVHVTSVQFQAINSDLSLFSSCFDDKSHKATEWRKLLCISVLTSFSFVCISTLRSRGSLGHSWKKTPSTIFLFKNLQNCSIEKAHVRL